MPHVSVNGVNFTACGSEFSCASKTVSVRSKMSESKIMDASESWLRVM